MERRMLRGALRRLGTAALLLGVVGAAPLRSADDPPTDWIDPDTGHRVIRLSTEAGTRSMYFHQNSITPDGR